MYLTIQPKTSSEYEPQWVADLLRMYLRWADARNLESRLIYCCHDFLGIADVTLHITTTDDFLLQEQGIHILRQVPTWHNPQELRHFMHACVTVYPDANRPIPDEALRIESYTPATACGQSRQRTENLVRITHLPTGLAVQANQERSLLRNRNNALGYLAARLALTEPPCPRHHEYVLNPTSRKRYKVFCVTDLGTALYHSTDPDAVLDGAIPRVPMGV